MDTGVKNCIRGERRTNERTKGTAELFEVNETVLVLVYQAEHPEGEGALDCAKSPGLQEGENHAELQETQLVLLQVGQTGVVMEQSWTVHCPVAAEEMLPLRAGEERQKIKKDDLSVHFSISYSNKCLIMVTIKISH